MKKERRIEFEVARIVACFIVICLHISSGYMGDEGVVDRALVVRCFLQDAIPIFWYITGFFLFADPERRFSKVLKNTVVKLLIPSLLLMLFSQIWAQWLYGNSSFIECLRQHNVDWYNLLSNLLSWNWGMTLCGHLSPIFSYFKVILWFPVLRMLCVDKPKENRCRAYVILLSVVYMLIMDWTQMYPFTIDGNSFMALPYRIGDGSILHVLLGYELYRNRQIIYEYSKSLFVIGILMFFIFNVQRFYLQKELFSYDIENTRFLGIDTLNSYLSSIGLFVALITAPVHYPEKVKKPLLAVASCSLGIYLVHRCVYEKLNNLGVRQAIYSLMTNNDGILLRLFCTFAYALIVFVLSLAVALALRWLRKAAVVGWKRLCSSQRRTA